MLPILGAGASYDCGVKLAGEIATDLYEEYKSDPEVESLVAGETRHLGVVADAIALRSDQLSVVKAIGLDQPDLWPDGDRKHEHYCAYRPLARLAREAPLAKTITLNYDCGYEAGLLSEGFRRGGALSARGQEFPDHFTVIADSSSYFQPRVHAFELFKPHGCAQRFRELAQADPATAADTIVIMASQLTNWRGAGWMRNEFKNAVARSVVLLVGVSASDPVIHGTLTDVFREVYDQIPATGEPRLIVIDHRPRTARLQTLVRLGLGKCPPKPGMVTNIDAGGTSLTSVLALLLTETLALTLENQVGLDLPSALEPRISEMFVAAPVMLRWTYLLRGRDEHQWAQRVNLLEAARNGYVPLTHDPAATSRLLQARRNLRARLRLPQVEPLAEVCRNHGFVVHQARAFLPVDVEQDELRGMCRPGGEPEHLVRDLDTPPLEPVLVSARGNGDVGFHMETGSEVHIP